MNIDRTIVSLSGIPLPPGFALLRSDHPTCNVYFDVGCLKPVIRNAELRVDFLDACQEVVVTFGNTRRPGRLAARELPVFGGPNVREGKWGNAFLGALNALLGDPVLYDGHDAYIYEAQVLSTQSDSSDQAIQMQLRHHWVIPELGPFMNGAVWRLVCFVEKT